MSNNGLVWSDPKNQAGGLVFWARILGTFNNWTSVTALDWTQSPSMLNGLVQGHNMAGLVNPNQTSPIAILLVYAVVGETIVGHKCASWEDMVN